MKQDSFRELVRAPRLGGCLAAIGVSLALCTGGANAQINRSRPPSAPPSSGGSTGRVPSAPAPRYEGSRSSQPSFSPPSYRSDGGRTPSALGRDNSSIGNPRDGQNALDRYNKTNEAAAARGKTSRPRGYYYGPIYPFSYFPGSFFPGDYIPYGYPPYPAYPYPDPTYPYPVPRGGSSLAARYDSPYYFCDDLSGAKYVSGGTVIVSKPKRLYTPTPVYRDGNLLEWRNLGADDYFADTNVEGKEYLGKEAAADDAALEKAIADIRQSWIDGDVAPLAAHVNKDTKIAIVLDGKYVYSLESGDFLGVTQAAFESTPRPGFVVDHLHRRDDGVYALTGRHLFTDNSGKERTVYFTYVLAKERSDYTITQVASAPDRE